MQETKDAGISPRAEKSENWPLGAAPIHRLRWKPYIVDRPEFLSGKCFSFQHSRGTREDYLYPSGYNT